MSTRADAERIAAVCEHQGYLAVRILPDESVACLMELLYTRSIILGCTAYGFEKRFCFKDRVLAARRFIELRSEDDEPEGYIARRPAIPCGKCGEVYCICSLRP